MPRYTVSSSGVDCKSIVTDSGGATPSPGTICLCSSVVERFFGKEEVVSPILTLGSTLNKGELE